MNDKGTTKYSGEFGYEDDYTRDMTNECDSLAYGYNE